MTMFTVALLQMAGHGHDQNANLQKGEAFCRRAAGLGADLALFPEMWNIAYTGWSDDTWREDYDFHAPQAQPAINAWRARAVGRESDFVQHFRGLAQELRMAIAITYLEAWDGPPRNSVTIFDRHGAEVLTYAKVHTCDFSMECVLTPGDDFYTGPLDFAGGQVQIGAMICYDREFPESARVLMLKGAEVILVPNACGLEANRLMQFQARAYENMTGLAMANYAAPDLNGHSIAVDGIAFGAGSADQREDQDDAQDDAQDGVSRDMTLIQAGEAEDIYLARFDLAALRDYRGRETWGNAFRKPRVYGPLVGQDVAPPFVRASARR